MTRNELKEKFIDSAIVDRPYRVIQILIHGKNSSWKSDVKLEVQADEYHLKQFVIFIKWYLDYLGVDLPYSIYEAVRTPCYDETKQTGDELFNENLIVDDKELRNFAAFCNWYMKTIHDDVPYEFMYWVKANTKDIEYIPTLIKLKQYIDENIGQFK